MEYAGSAHAALDDAEICVVATDWAEFRDRPIADYRRLLRHAVMVDFRNMFDLAEMAREGFAYHSVGRAAIEEYVGHLEGEVPLRKAV